MTIHETGRIKHEVSKRVNKRDAKSNAKSDGKERNFFQGIDLRLTKFLSESLTWTFPPLFTALKTLPANWKCSGRYWGNRLANFPIGQGLL